MTGDLKEWKGSDVATPSNVKFFRKGGWFVSRAQAAVAIIIIAMIFILAIMITKHYTELKYENGNSTIVIPETDGIQNVTGVLRPLSYELYLEHRENSVSGEVELGFLVLSDLGGINLNFSGNEVSAPSIICDNETSVNVSNIYYEKKNDIVTVLLSTTLQAREKCKLKLNFKGKINQEEKGVYKTHYRVPNTNGSFEDRWIIGTNFAPNYCSRTFPCIKDSTERVTLRVKLLRQRRHFTISNIFQMAPRERSEFPGEVVDDYEWTPPLPLSSLSYFILEDYEVKTVSGISPSLNICYPRHFENVTEPLVRAITSLLVFFADYFQTPLPLQRLSIVIIDGLASQRPAPLGIIPISSSYLYSSVYKNPQREEDLYYYLGQKLSNLWLGNLVNFNSWSDFWLQEGFALYMADLAAAKVYLGYNEMKLQQSVLERALLEESFIHSVPIPFLEDVEYKGYSQYKGAYLFQMLAGIINPQNFKKGVQNFLNEWKLKTAATGNFWGSFNSVQDSVNVLSFFASWNKSSYPLVIVSRENGTVTLGQVNGNIKPWNIPITYITGEDLNEKRTWLNETTSHLSVGQNVSYILVNPHQSGFFLTNYTADLWSELTEALLDGSMAVPSQVIAGLIDDSFSLSHFNLLSYDIPLNLTKSLKGQMDLTTWLTTMKHLDHIAIILHDEEEDISSFQAFVRDLINSSSVIIKEPNGEENALGKLLYYWMCKYNASECKYGSDYLRGHLFCYGDNNQTTDIENTIELSRQSMAEPNQELYLLLSILCTENEDQFTRILDMSVNTSDPFFSLDKTIKIWTSLKDIGKNSRIAFRYLMKTWPSIYNKFNKESTVLKAILEGSTHAFTKREDVYNIKTLYMETQGDKKVKEILNYIQEQVHNRAALKRHSVKYIADWLRNNREISS